jgi:hypothetical protein
VARRRIGLVAVVLTVMAAACSGPRSPVDVGVKEINTDVLIGPKEPTAVASPPASSPPGPIGFPGFVQPPVNPHPPLPTPSPVTCPQAHPLAPIERALTSAADTPPAAATYRFRNQGTWKIGERSGAFPVTSTRTVSNVVKAAPGGGYTFDVSIPDPAGPVTTTTYHVYPTQPRPIDPTPGIYIEQVTERADEDVLTRPGGAADAVPGSPRPDVDNPRGRSGVADGDAVHRTDHRPVDRRCVRHAAGRVDGEHL